MVNIVRQNYVKNKKKFYEIECQLKKQLGCNVDINHVGSTAIPKMSGKNIIDILIGAKNEQEFEELKFKLIKLGYYASDSSKTDEYQFFASTKEETKAGDIHIHLVLLFTERYNEFILLKNYLLKNKEESKKYSNYKRQILKLNGKERSAYRDKKSKFVNDLITKSKSNKNYNMPLSITMIRHGENIYDDSLENDLLPLSKLGKKQAKWAQKILDGDFDIIISSPSKRAKMTSYIIGSGLDFIQDFRLIERGWGNKNRDGKETDIEARQRFKDLLDDIYIKYSGKKILLVAHGSLIKLAQDVIEQKIMMRDSVDNCSIIKYERKKTSNQFDVKKSISPFTEKFTTNKKEN